MLDQAQTRCCRACACYQPHPMQIDVGFCFCMPPSAIPIRQPDGSTGVVAAFPPVTADNYCFQWRARPDIAAHTGEAAAISVDQEPSHAS